LKDKSDPALSFNHIKSTERTVNSTSNGCLMRLTPISIFTHKLDNHQMYAAVRLQTLFTHANETTIAACYLYTFAISKLINGADAKTAYGQTKQEALESPDLKSR
jgi:ADP-ribosylglycohydrolase